MSDEELAIAVDFVKGCYRVLVEIRDEIRAMRKSGTPTQAALPLDEDEGLPEPGAIAHAIAAAPRKWGNTVKWYDAAWREFGGKAFLIEDTFANSMLVEATNGKVGVASYARVLSALVKAKAAERHGRDILLHEPTDELRSAVEEARKGRRTAAEGGAE